MKEFWGKKKFAYPIDHNNHGYYNLIEFDLEKEKLAKIENTLRMSQEIVRYMTVKKRVKTEEEIQEEKKVAEKIAAKSLEQKEQEEKEEKKEEKDAKKSDKRVDLIWYGRFASRNYDRAFEISLSC